jgi:hypothetical protein
MSTTELAELAADTGARCNWCERTDTQPAILAIHDDDETLIEREDYNACPDHVAMLKAFVERVGR